jgi:7,8-dihydropterin-6-yl-methyl-4-(beta-D-ribofuranosyl)aminobenzene 5'-phosphate synthase
MLDAVEERVGGPIYAVLGGTHLKDSPRKAIESSADYLRRKMVTQVGVSHCTGSAATAQLRAEHAGFFENRTGSVFTLSE